MPLPKPPVALTDVCSVIYDNTLYTYSAGAFQSLRLEVGAQWKQLSQGVAVTGATCIGSTPVAPREPGFWVIGGQGGPADYKGLQKFTFSSGKWETFNPPSSDVQNRLYHGAAYINDTDSILIYAGTQDGTKHTATQTFTIGASAPFEVRSYDSSAPPTTNPMLLPWSSTQAILVGGSETNKQVMLFTTGNGWSDLGASLATPLTKDIATTRSVVIAGDDGSKSLYTFDMSQSPNKVTRTVLINGQGQPVQNSQPVARDLEKRLSSAQWPEYNSTYAPTATRTNYGIAQDAAGQVVLAGGNSDEPLAIFDGRQNSWSNAAAIFEEQQVLSISSESTTTSTTPTPTPTSSSVVPSTTSSATRQSQTTTGAAAPVPVAEPASSSPAGTSSTTILAAVLGTTGAILVLLGILYCLLRRKRRGPGPSSPEAGQMNQARAIPPSEKAGFGDDGYSQGPPLGAFRGHQQQDSQASFSSMAILMGKVNQPKMQAAERRLGVERKPSKDSKRSSTSSILNTAFKKSISHPMPQSPQSTNPFSDPSPPYPKDEKTNFGAHLDVGDEKLRGEGPEGVRRSSGWNRYWSTGGNTLNILGFGNNGASRRTTVASEASSHYSAQPPNRITQDSATVPALSVNRMPGPKPEFSRVNSGSPTISQYSPHIRQEMQGRIERPMSAESGQSAYSSGIPASVHDAWDPTASSSKPWGTDRAPSSAYLSIYTTASKVPPSGVSTQPQLSHAATSSDMSWLNLGAEGHKDQNRF